MDDMLIVGRDIGKIDKLKKELSKCFEMKDLRFASQILGIKISWDMTNGKLWLSQESYMKKVLDKFNTGKAKLVSCPLGSHLKLSSKQSPSSEKEKEEMQKVPYASVVGSLMYVMVCTRHDIAHVLELSAGSFLILIKNIGLQWNEFSGIWGVLLIHVYVLGLTNLCL